MVGLKAGLQHYDGRCPRGCPLPPATWVSPDHLNDLSGLFECPFPFLLFLVFFSHPASFLLVCFSLLCMHLSSLARIFLSPSGAFSFLLQAYYNLVTDFYSYGWTDCYHFSSRYREEPLLEALHRAEHYLAYRLDLQKGMKCVDLGCGIGGPLRNIARFTGNTSITGITIS